MELAGVDESAGFVDDEEGKDDPGRRLRIMIWRLVRGLTFWRFAGGRVLRGGM
jgi:hypothetical protein